MGERELSSIFGNNSVYNKYNVNELIVTFVGINSQLPDNLRDKFFAKFGIIWKTRSYRETLIELCRLGAATQFQLEKSVGMSDSSISRAINYLHKNGLIKPATRVRSAYSKGGPRPIVWAPLNYAPEDIIKASEEHVRSSTPSFSEAERISQLILDEYLSLKPDWLQNQINFKEIIEITRKNTTNFQVADVANLVALQLQNSQGVNVWR